MDVVFTFLNAYAECASKCRNTDQTREVKRLDKISHAAKEGLLLFLLFLSVHRFADPVHHLRYTVTAPTPQI